jgi:hypothetical protein
MLRLAGLKADEAGTRQMVLYLGVAVRWFRYVEAVGSFGLVGKLSSTQTQCWQLLGWSGIFPRRKGSVRSSGLVGNVSTTQELLSG